MTRPLNILFPYTGDSVGGSHISSLLLARALREAGHEVTLGLHRRAGALVDHLAAENEPWVPLPDVEAPKLRAAWRSALARRRTRRGLAEWLGAHRFDIVHTHDMRNHLIWSAADGPAHVWHQRTPASGKHMARWGLRAAAFIAVSRFTLQSLPVALQGHARMIYNPFLPQQPASEEARAALCAALGVAPGTAVVGYVANFSDRKRPELFVEIAARVRAAHSGPLVFPMYGALHQPFLGHVEARIAELGLGDAVRLVGPQSPFGPVMAGFSALVAPARNEALGRTLIEAGLAGVPLIATREGGNTEIVEDGVTGHLVAPDDVEGFAQAVLEVLSDPESSAARCAAAQTRCERLFSLGAHVSAIEAIYDEIT
ncbi:glycosyltransferase family 4 protein [bacterium]|nr:glycosyltransferase family 4 protein [bacterium]